MPSKAVLNLKNFSLGKSNSMASVLSPTIDLVQDVWPYDVARDFLTNDPIGTLEFHWNAMKNGLTQPGHNSVYAMMKFAKKVNPLLWDDKPIAFISQYADKFRRFRYYTWVDEHLQTCKAFVERAYEDMDFEAFRKNMLGPEEQPQGEDKEYFALDIAYWYDYSSLEGDPIIMFWKDLSGLLSRMIPDEEEDFTEEFLDEFFNRVVAAIEELQNDMGLEDMRDEMLKVESPLPYFFFVIRCIVSLVDMNDHEENQKKILEQTVELKKQLVENFESLRRLHNRCLLEEYRDSSVEFPYFLDLGFSDVTQTNEKSDTEGAQMHSIQREVTRGDKWQNNHNYGDKLRIRDMFRADKLNKRSAYESAALYPGVVGPSLDDAMESEDVVSRLVQDDWNDYGVVGCATTPDGLYLLSEPDDSISAAVRSTKLGETNQVVPTNTFRAFNKELLDADYLKTGIVESAINFMRTYGPEDDAYSSGSDFLKWYYMFHTAVTVYPNEIYTEGSLLRMLGLGSYQFYPSKDGIKFVKDAYEKEQEDEDSNEPISLKIPGDGFMIKASIEDNNYKSGEIRLLNIEVPYNPNSQYSYVTLSFGLMRDNSLAASGKTFSIEFALDNELPIRYYFEQDKVDNLDPSNSLYESLKSLSAPSVNTMGEVTFVIENDLLNEKPHILHVGVSANYPELTSGSWETTKAAYKKTYVVIADPSVAITGTQASTTYGNYNQFTHEQGNSVTDYWNLSRSVYSAPYQYLLEVPHTISLNATKTLYSNYQTADLFSDVITMKNHMDSEYRMEVETGVQQFDVDRFRHYTGIDSCSGTISLYYDCDDKMKTALSKDNGPQENLSQEYEVENKEPSEHIHSTGLKYKRIETIKSINRFTESIRHKSNLFSVIISNSKTEEALAEARQKVIEANAIEDKEALAKAMEEEEQVKDRVAAMRKIIETMTRNICNEYSPAHNQLFKVYWE